MMKMYEYDIALSYASEDTAYAETLAAMLRGQNVNLFFDRYERATLWGKNFYNYLCELSQNRVRYHIVFLSEHYAKSLWSKRELEIILAQVFEESYEYILPIRLDRTDVPAMLAMTKCLDWFLETPEDIVEIILEKLGRPSIY